MATNIVLIEGFKPEEKSIEACLLELEKYGNPWLAKQKSGWFTSIDVFVTGEGVEFEVKSDFGHAKPKDALNQCFSRLVIAIRDIKDTT